jgi:hypothetical protein
MVQHDVAPVLTPAEVDDLLLLALRADVNGYTPYSLWAASTVYTGQVYRIPTVSNGHQYIVTTAGTSGSTEPVWPTTSGTTVADGTVVWTERGAYLYQPTYDLRTAACEGWRWKAAKAVGEVQAALGGGVQFFDNQVFDHCMAMVKFYGGGSGGGSGIGAVQLTRDYASRWRT